MTHITRHSKKTPLFSSFQQEQSGQPFLQPLCCFSLVLGLLIFSWGAHFASLLVFAIMLSVINSSSSNHIIPQLLVPGLFFQAKCRADHGARTAKPDPGAMIVMLQWDGHSILEVHSCNFPLLCWQTFHGFHTSYTMTSSMFRMKNVVLLVIIMFILHDLNNINPLKKHTILISDDNIKACY
jgi:hypothetical protein